jgi:hypothetical protein
MNINHFDGYVYRLLESHHEMQEIKNVRHQLTNSAHTIVEVNIADERQRHAARLHARQALSACLLKWHGCIREDQQVHWQGESIKVAKAQATKKHFVRLLLKERLKHSALCALRQ